MGQGCRVFAIGLVGLCYLLIYVSKARSEESGTGGSCVARVDVYQGGSKKTSFSKIFSYKARVRPNTRECSVVDWQLSWDYHRKDNGRLEKDAMLLATTVERGEGNATEEGEVQEDTNDTELNFHAENVSCRLCEASRKKQTPATSSSEKSHSEDNAECPEVTLECDCPEIGPAAKSGVRVSGRNRRTGKCWTLADAPLYCEQNAVCANAAAQGEKLLREAPKCPYYTLVCGDGSKWGPVSGSTNNRCQTAGELLQYYQNRSGCDGHGGVVDISSGGP